MPKHAFKFPAIVVHAIRQHVQNAVRKIEPARYRQEANYTAALVSHLAGTAYSGEHGLVDFESTVFDDRAPGSAEHEFGADYAITATVSDGTTTIRKAILVQAKLGRVDELSASKRDFMKLQIRKMKRLVKAPKVMEVPEHSGERFPAMISGNNLLADRKYVPMALHDYFTSRVITTLDGCTNSTIVEAVQDSSLSRINITAKYIPLAG